MLYTYSMSATNKSEDSLQEKHLHHLSCCQTSWFCGTLFLLQRSTGRPWYSDMSIWWTFSGKRAKWANHSRKAIKNVVNDKIQALEQKLKLYKTWIYDNKLDSFPILQEFSHETGGHINISDIFKILGNIMCQHLETLFNFVYTLNFPYNQCRMF